MDLLILPVTKFIISVNNISRSQVCKFSYIREKFNYVIEKKICMYNN